MEPLQLFAVTKAGLQPLPLPDNVTGFDNLYEGVAKGVYSALRTFSHDKFLYLDAHLARTRQSMELLGWTYQPDEMELRQALHEAVTAYPHPDARVRFDILAAPAVQWGSDSRVLIALMPFTPIDPSLYEKGIAVGVAPDLSRRRPLAKTADFAIRRREYAESHPEKDVYEYLMLDDTGHILEGTGSNFYAVRDGVFYTAGSGVLQGIARKIILDLLPELGITLCPQPVHVDDLADIDEAAMSSSSRALLPIVKINGQVIGDGRPGPVCRRILTAYNMFVANRIKTAVDLSGE